MVTTLGGPALPAAAAAKVPPWAGAERTRNFSAKFMLSFWPAEFGLFRSIDNSEYGRLPGFDHAHVVLVRCFETLGDILVSARRVS